MGSQRKGKQGKLLLVHTEVGMPWDSSMESRATCKYIKCHWIVHSKVVNFMLYESDNWF